MKMTRTGAAVEPPVQAPPPSGSQRPEVLALSKKATPPVETVPISQLFCSPTNPRRNDAAIPHVAASLRRFGWQQPIVARRTGEVIAGNTRLKAAQELGMTEVPVWWFDGDDLAAVAFSIADNRTHEFAEWNDAELAKLLAQLKKEDSLDGVGYSDEDLDALVQQLRDQEQADKDLDDDGADEPPKVAIAKTGDLWVLGDHRLLCGDSTSLKDVLRVMDGEKAALVATDPPYLVDYTGERPNDSGKDWTDSYREIDIQDADGFFKPCSPTCSKSSGTRPRSTAGTRTSDAATSSASGATSASSTTSRSSG
jgi:ParB-like chromosome segregation protein Spo0J